MPIDALMRAIRALNPKNLGLIRLNIDRKKAIRGPEPIFKGKDFPYRISFILRQGTWWIVERAQDLRVENKPCYLEEEAEILVPMFLPEKASFKVDSLSQLTPELVDQLFEDFLDPINGNPSKSRKSIGILSLHIDDLIISGIPQFLKCFLEKIKKHFIIGYEDINDLIFIGQRVRWIFDKDKRKKYISIDQKFRISELEEIIIPKHLKNIDLYDKQLHISYRSLLGYINWGCNPEYNFRFILVFPGWHQPQLLQLLVTARSLISFADGSAMMKLRCVRGLGRILLELMEFLILPLGITVTNPLSVL